MNKITLIWQKIKDEVGYMHFLPINNEYMLKVEKSRGCDYFISVTSIDGDCIDSELVYKPTLAIAKRVAISLVESGAWKHMI